MLKVCKYFDTELEAEEDEDEEIAKVHAHQVHLCAMLDAYDVDGNVRFECVCAMRVHVCVKIHKKGNGRIYFR